MQIDRLFGGMNTSASGMSAQRKRMNAIAENLANAETTRTPNGEPYRRQQVVLAENREFERNLEASVSITENLARSHKDHLPGIEANPDRYETGGVKASVTKDMSPFREVYDPTHPEADGKGMVRLPNVDIVTEMTELISASRAFEANVTAFNATKGMMKKALEL